MLIHLARLRLKRKYILGGLFLAFSIAICVTIILYWDKLEYLKNYGYFFVFLASFLAGFSIPNPIPYFVVVFSMSSVLNPALVGIISGIAAGLGGTLLYLIGRSGRELFPKTDFFSPDNNKHNGIIFRWTSRIIVWANRRGSIVVFLVSALFNPFFSPVAISLGAIRYSLWKFFVLCTAGNTVKSFIVAYCGYFGLGSLLRWLGAD